MLTEEMVADLIPGLGLGKLLDYPWQQIPAVPCEGTPLSFGCKCAEPRRAAFYRRRINGYLPEVSIVTLAPVSVIKVKVGESHTRSYYLHVGQCETCGRVFWCATRNHPMTGEPLV